MWDGDEFGGLLPCWSEEERERNSRGGRVSRTEFVVAIYFATFDLKPHSLSRSPLSLSHSVSRYSVHRP
jgi:hypothetical protein